MNIIIKSIFSLACAEINIVTLITKANNKAELIAKVLYLYKHMLFVIILKGLKQNSSYVILFYLHFKPEQFLRENIVCIVIKPGETKEMQKKGFHLYVKCSVVHILEVHKRPQCHDVTDEPRSLTHGHQSFTRHLDYLWKRQGKVDSMKYHLSG